MNIKWLTSSFPEGKKDCCLIQIWLSESYLGNRFFQIIKDMDKPSLGVGKLEKERT